MGGHTFDVARADDLEDPRRYRYLSRDELLALIDPAPDEIVADLGSGTGFYTEDVAGRVATLYAVHVQPAMHDYYRRKGMAPSVTPVAASVGDLPFDPAALDAAYSTMTFHEFVGDGALARVREALAPGGRLVVADWSAAGEGEDGAPMAERYDAATAADLIADAGFDVRESRERPETFVLRAVRES